MSKSQNRQRDDLVQARVTHHEKLEIKHNAEQLELTVPGFIRFATLEKEQPAASRRPPSDKRDLAQILGQIGRIGSNTNQLAKIANYGDWPERDMIQGACDDIRWMRVVLMRALGVEPRKP